MSSRYHGFCDYVPHEQIFMGWTATFKRDDGKKWGLEIGPKYESKIAAEMRVLEICPDAKDIRLDKNICEV